MKIYLLILFIVFAVAQSSAQCSKTKKSKTEKTTVSETIEFKDLPDGVKLTDEVRVNKFNEDGIIISFELISVGQKLKQIGAKYVNGKLVDKTGKEIRFYKPQIPGASQGSSEDEKERKREEKKLAELKEKFTVIEIFVNPFNIM